MRVKTSVFLLALMALCGLPELIRAALPTVEEAYQSCSTGFETPEEEKMHKEIIAKILLELQNGGYSGDEKTPQSEFKSDNSEETNDESSSTKKLSELDLSESDIDKIFTEAVRKAEKETPKREIRSTRQTTYQARHYRRNYSPESEKKTRQALIMEKVITKLRTNLGISHDEAAKLLSQLEEKNDNINYKRDASCLIAPSQCTLRPRRKFRSLDGTCNNLRFPCLGSADTPFARLVKAAYADGARIPRRSRNSFPLPNARKFSSLIFREINNPAERLTHIVMTWGQFLDHDITLAAGQPSQQCPTKTEECNNGGECFGISVPPTDSFRVDRKVPVKCLQVIRSAPAVGSSPREQVNTITSYIDASQVYGSNEEQLNAVREGKTSRLLVVSDDIAGALLPEAEPEQFCAAPADNPRPCFRAGDERVNENQALMAMHTLFVREHNRIAKKLEELNGRRWSQEQIFLEARKIVGAVTQHITYNEFLTQILNCKTRARFRLNLLRSGRFRYRDSVNPSILNGFATAAYRFGHSLVQNQFGRPGRTPIKTNTFYDPTPIFEGVDPIFQGLAQDPAQTVDRSFARAITDNLTLSNDVIIDLPAVNIQRGREHGLPGYISFRQRCGLGTAVGFDDLKCDFTYENLIRLFYLYRRVENIDLFAGAILEKPLPGGALGPTFSCILGIQFRRLRVGDRFWYETADRSVGFSDFQLAEIRKASLARVICDNNNNINTIQPKVMRQPNNLRNKQVLCSSLPAIDLTKWKVF